MRWLAAPGPYERLEKFKSFFSSPLFSLLHLLCSLPWPEVLLSGASLLLKFPSLTGVTACFLSPSCKDTCPSVAILRSGFHVLGRFPLTTTCFCVIVVCSAFWILHPVPRLFGCMHLPFFHSFGRFHGWCGHVRATTLHHGWHLPCTR